jgi:hypothetical protein
MKKSITRPGALLLTIFSLTIPLQAQNFNETIRFADLQFEQANYQLAVKEYQRALFFGDGDSANYLYKQIAMAFFRNMQFEQASYFFDLSYNTSDSDSIKKELIFNKAQCYLLSGEFEQGVAELSSLSGPLNTYFKNKQNFYFAVCYFGLEDYKKAESYFLKLVPNNNLAQIEIQKLFGAKKNLYRPNPKTAKTLSRIIPGSGQLYSGDLKNGLNSLLLTGGIAIVGLHIYNKYSLFDSMMSVLSWFNRYYKGGYQNAYNIASQKKARRKDNTFKQILQIIQKNKLQQNLSQ